jgi:hypothetical protein
MGGGGGPAHAIAVTCRRRCNSDTTTVLRPVVVDITQRLAGEHMQVRDLADYEVAQ